MTLADLTRRRTIAYIGGLVAFISPAAPAQTADPRTLGKLDQDLVRETVKSLGDIIRREYIDAEVGSHIEMSLRQLLAENRYAAVGSLDALASLLSGDLFDLSRDKHLSVAVVPDLTRLAPVHKTSPSESRETAGRRSNFGIQRVEILPGNIGYINITWFYRPDESRQVISAAMQVLHNADALVVDLRDNGGGSPDTVSLVASYFFDTPDLPLFEIIPRSGKGGRIYRTEAASFPERDGRRPVYILTAAGTFSGGEGLAFLLQERHRAEVIGETTAGAANPGRPYPVNTRFEVTVPNGKVQSAIGHRNWEGVGVTPDVKTTAPEALRVAHLRALRQLIDRVPVGDWRNKIESEIRILDRQ